MSKIVLYKKGNALYEHLMESALVLEGCPW